MRSITFATAVFGTLALGAAFGTASAAPGLPGRLASPAAGSIVEQVRWTTVCDRRGRHCHRVWVRDRHRDHRMDHDRR